MPSEPPSLPMWLDLANERLWCGDQALALRPKTFALLRYLVAHPGQLLTKAALLEALWPETMVSEVVLSVCIRELRQVLGDDPRAPRFIETVHRRGYRFIGHLSTARPSAPHTSSLTPLPLLAGRERELDALHGALATALTGGRQLLFVTGEAGLGKTTLVDAFLTALEAYGPLWVGRGQCLEHYGAGEAYLPVLEALERLCRGPGGKEVVALLGQQAPTWLVQMPGLVCAADQEALQRRIAGATRDRMLRELAEALDLLTARQPLLLILEDLHWSDYSTLDLLAVLARRREPARLLLLGTYRLPDALQRGHPLYTVHHELQRHGQCTELPLPLLSEAAVTAYLAMRFPAARLPAELAHLVHQRTEGNPLFMVTVVEDWVRRGWLVPTDGGWTLRVALAAFASTVPESIRQMLEQQLDRLNPLEQQVLEVGSVAGAIFSAAAVAAGLVHEVVEVDDWCAGLARRRQWLEACGEHVWPDGTVAGSYRFTHALYQEVAYHRLTAARRAQLHRRIGEREETGYGLQVRERAAVLAMHFVRGQDSQRAVRYLQYAGENALQRSAYPEALQHLTQGLALLATLPATPTHHQRELDLLMALVLVLKATKGDATPEMASVLTRAAALCQQVGESPQQFAVLDALCISHFMRAEYQAAQTVAEQFLDLAQRQHNPAMLLRAHGRLGQTLFIVGAFAPARTHLEQALALLDPRGHTNVHTALGRRRDYGLTWLLQIGRALCVLGYPDQAVQRSQEGLTMAHALASPLVLADALHGSALIQRYCRAWPTVQAYAEAILALATEHGLARHVALGTLFRGMALAGQGQSAVGLAQMRQSLAAYQATGSVAGMSGHLAQLAEAYGQVGQTDKGRHLLAEALALVDTTGERHAEAELHRLHGELLLRQALPDARAAEACFQRALNVARGQQAKWWELRAAMSLARLWQHQGKRAKAQALLAPIYGWFTEGFDTADLQDARTLLEALS